MAKLPAADRIIFSRQGQYFEVLGSDTCVPTTLMNAVRQASGKELPNPSAELLRLDRVGPTDADGTSQAGMAREARALGLGFRPLGQNLTLARQLSQQGVPIATDINPGRLPLRIQNAAGGRFQSAPQGHEVLLASIDAQDGAVVEDPELGRYTLSAAELKRAIGPEGVVKALPLSKNGWIPA
jgi:hypothetical protein